MARVIEYARDRPTRVQHYRELIKLAQASLAYADQAAALLWRAPDPMTVALWHAEFRHYRPLIERIIAQTERRVLQGEAIPANDKIVSLFEPHADIIVKGGREVQYGHKLNLTTGRSGLILDLVIEAGNPADSERFLPMLNRHIGFYGEAPRQTAADGGFASRHNLGEAKALGVRDVAFHKKAGLRVMDMVKSNWVYRKLRNFRAGIESDISCLKRAYGLARCIWRGLDHFRAYVWSSVVAYNLALFARLKPMTAHGLFRAKKLDQFGVCIAFEVIGLMRRTLDPGEPEAGATGWGVLIRFRDGDGHDVTAFVEFADLHRNPSEVCATLAHIGMSIVPAASSSRRLRNI